MQSPYNLRMRTRVALLLVSICGLPLLAQDEDPLTTTHCADPHATGVPTCNPPGPFGLPGSSLPPDQIGAWDPVNLWPVQATHATLLHTGKLLFWREGSALGEPTYTLVWNPASPAGLKIVISPSSELFCSGHAALADGRIIAGGGNLGSEIGWGPVDTNIFDPQTESWTRVADMAYGRYYSTLTLLGDGRVVAISGAVSPGHSASIPEVYDAAVDSWTTLFDAANTMTVYPHNFLIPDGRVLFAGPSNNTLALNVQTWNWEELPDSPYSNVVGSAVQYEPGKIMKCGGGSNMQQYPYDGKTQIIDMTATSPTWTVVSPMTYPRAWHSLVLLPDGRVLAVGGATAGTGYSGECSVHAPELWDPVTKSWSIMASHQRPRQYHSTAILLPDGRVLAAGGENHPFGENNYEIFSPPYLFHGARPAIHWAPSSIGYGATFTVQTQSEGSIDKVALLRVGSVTHGLDENQRYVPLQFSLSAPQQLSVIAPPNPNWAPPGYYLLFLLDADGAPSVGQFTHLSTCNATADNETNCSDLLDNDCDGLQDQADPQCGPVTLPFAPAGAVPDGGRVSGAPLTVEKVPGQRIRLSWSPSCAPGSNDYAIYEGTIGDWDSHMPLFCSTGGATTRTFGRLGSNYYIVVPRNGVREGSYGLDSAGNERPPSAMACLPQEVGGCP